MFYKNPVLLQETRDVLFGAGRPREGGAVVHELPGHDERVPPLQLAVVALPVVMNPKTVVTPQLIKTSQTNGLQTYIGEQICLRRTPMDFSYPLKAV